MGKTRNLFKKIRDTMGTFHAKMGSIKDKNRILFSYKKRTQVSSNKVDETGAYYTEWSKPERKTPIQYINAYIWNLERW